MATFSTVHQGLAYGDGVMKGAGQRGKCVKMDGDDTFALNTSAAVQTIGFLKSDAADGTMPTVMCNGGIYETDVFTTGIAAGDNLICGADSKLAKAAGEQGEIVIGRALSVSGGVLKFISLV